MALVLDFIESVWFIVDHRVMQTETLISWRLHGVGEIWALGPVFNWLSSFPPKCFVQGNGDRWLQLSTMKMGKCEVKGKTHSSVQSLFFLLWSVELFQGPVPVRTQNLWLTANGLEWVQLFVCLFCSNTNFEWEFFHHSKSNKQATWSVWNIVLSFLGLCYFLNSSIWALNSIF